MGENKKKVFYTGCPSIDVAKSINFKIDNNFFKNIVDLKVKNVMD